MQLCWSLSLSLLPLLCCLACNNSKPPIGSPTDVTVYASLPGLTKTHNTELQAEFARIVAERATPLQLGAKALRLDSDQLQIASMPKQRSVTADFDAIFLPNFRESTHERIEKVWPQSGFEFSPATLHAVAAVLQRYDTQRVKYEKHISDIDFDLPVNHSLGLSADTSYLDAVAIGNQLEGLFAAQLLAAGEPEAAIEQLRLMLRVSELLAEQKSIVSRGAAVLRRREALQVLEGIARHAAVTPSVQRQLKMMLDQQLERWPNDADAWIGDRAQGMHTYELVRDGHLLSLLSYDEVRDYRDEIGIAQLAEVVAKNIDQDELFYLQTMRDVVDSCRKPHYTRDATFRQIELNLELLRGGDDYPFVADQLLLLELGQGSRLIALDRAWCEAWALALRIACGDVPPNSTLNPLTGDAFYLDISESQVVVDAVDPERGHAAAIVPRLPSNISSIDARPTTRR